MKLKDWIKREGIKAQDFARRIDYSPSGLSRIIHGEYVPSKRIIKRIEQETKGKVKPSDWYKDDDEENDGTSVSVGTFLMMDDFGFRVG